MSHIKNIINYQGGILLKNTNFCFKSKQKNGYIFLPLYDKNKTVILYTNSKNIKNANENLYVIVTLNDDNINNISLYKIVGIVSNLNNQIAILQYNNYLFHINSKRELDDEILTIYKKYICELKSNNTYDIITIDSPRCKCMDNAISYDLLNEILIIHISDPNILHEIYSLNKYYDNYTSIYLTLFNIPLLPEELCLDLLSLKENTVRPVISIYFDIYNFNIINICRQNVMITKNLTYITANDALNNNKYNIKYLFKCAKILEKKFYCDNKILKDTRDMNELFMILTNNSILNLLDLSDNCVGKTITAPLRRTADFINHQIIIEKIGYNIKEKYNITDIDYYNNFLNNVKIINDKAKYLVIADKIINNTYYLCKLLNIYKDTHFTWYLCKYDIKFTCELCDANFFNDYKIILENLKINEFYNIKLFKVVLTKYKFINIMFEF